MSVVCLLFLILGSMNLFGNEDKRNNNDWALNVIRQESKAIRSCYEVGLKISPELKGRILVDFEIGINGLVQNAKVESSTMNNEIVENCLIEKVKLFKFPIPPEKTVVQIKFPFNFAKVQKPQ